MFRKSRVFKCEIKSLLSNIYILNTTYYLNSTRFFPYTTDLDFIYLLLTGSYTLLFIRKMLVFLEAPSLFYL